MAISSNTVINLLKSFTTFNNVLFSIAIIVHETCLVVKIYETLYKKDIKTEIIFDLICRSSKLRSSGFFSLIDLINESSLASSL